MSGRFISLLVLLTLLFGAPTAVAQEGVLAENPSLAGESSSQSSLYTANGQILREGQEQPLSTSQPVFDLFGTANPSGKLLYSVLTDQLALYVSLPDGTQERQVVSGDLAWAGWAPIGDRFIYWTTTGQLFLAHAGSRQIKTELVAEQVTAASFSPDGRSLAILRNNAQTPSTGLYLLNLKSKQEQLLTKTIAAGIGIRGYVPLWSPDGRYILFLQDATPGTEQPFGVVAVAQGQVLTLPYPLPVPASPLYLRSDGNQFTYGTEELDAPTVMWTVEVDLAKGLVLNAYESLDRWPVGWLEVGNKLLVATPDGLAVSDQDSSTEAQSKEIILGSGLYEVKYKSPVSGSPGSYFSHSNTDPRADGPYNYYCTYTGRSGHKGTDFAKVFNTAIKAGASGVVEYVKNDCQPKTSCTKPNPDPCPTGFGNYVRVRHANSARTYYAHMSNTNVAVNQSVTRSTTLGYVGNTGNSTGCHLHFEIRHPDTSSSNAVDPYYGPCNWITESLWEGAQPLGSISNPCTDETK